MKITVDTNLLPKAAVQDNLRQVHQAAKALQDNEFVALPFPVLCEFIRALKHGWSDESCSPDHMPRTMDTRSYRTLNVSVAALELMSHTSLSG